MNENLLVSIENKGQTKKWRNFSIILVCFLLIFISKSFKNDEKIEEKTSGDSIAEIEITGVIDDNDFRNKKISDLISNKTVKAVILNIDSPGGMVTASEILYDLINKLNETKPVVVLMGSMATSGAYMVSMGSDYLIAKNTTITGSIGVLMQSYEFVDLAKKFGVELKTFKSSELKGIPSIFEKNTESSDKASQSMIDDIYNYFVELVKNKRKMTDENFKLAINGQAFTGRQALKIGLIDEIGGKESALKYLKSKNIDTSLPIIKVKLYKEKNTGILSKLVEKFFFDIDSKSNFKNIMLLGGIN